MNNDLFIRQFEPELAGYFDRINRQWIEKMFSVETLDDEMLRDPKRIIIDQGGYIWFAESPGVGVIGTCALCRQDEGVFELTKMGVLEKARGLKAGETLLKYVLTQAIKKNLGSVFLLTNKKCEAAIHLYEKFGFKHDESTMQRYGANYERCNVAMLLDKTAFEAAVKI